MIFKSNFSLLRMYFKHFYLKVIIYNSSSSTFHESGVGPAVVVEVCAVDVHQAVVPQLLSVAQTLQDGVHETLETEKQKN